MIRVEADGDVGVLLLDRAAKRNALTPEMLGALPERAREAAAGRRALVLAGEGPVFCAGFDLKMCAGDALGQTMRDLLSGLGASVAALRGLEVPIVIAAHGAAVAGGAALLGGGDVVVVDADAKIGYPVVKIGVSPAVSAAFLIHSVFAGGVRERLLDPELIDGRAAHRIGMAHEVVDRPEDVRPRALELAHRLAFKPGRAASATRAWLHEIEIGMTALGAEAPTRGLAASLSIAGNDDERARLGEMWGGR
ncbi:MAG: enoyl-CoA hydratase/isomerase family protein [Phycisphaerales bacterium]